MLLSCITFVVFVLFLIFADDGDQLSLCSALKIISLHRILVKKLLFFLRKAGCCDLKAVFAALIGIHDDGSVDLQWNVYIWHTNTCEEYAVQSRNMFTEYSSQVLACHVFLCQLFMM